MASPDSDDGPRDDGPRDDGTDSEADFRKRVRFSDGVVAGAVATVAMGLVIMGTDLDLLRQTIAGLYGQEGNLVAGWIVHLVHGTLFGLIFAVVLSDPTLHSLRHPMWKTVIAGVAYGILLTVFGAGIIMPMWLEFVGLRSGLTIPAISSLSLLWHVVYGIVLGVVFSFLSD